MLSGAKLICLGFQERVTIVLVRRLWWQCYSCSCHPLLSLKRQQVWQSALAIYTHLLVLTAFTFQNSFVLCSDRRDFSAHLCEGYWGLLCSLRSYFLQLFPFSVMSGRWKEAFQDMDGNTACWLVPPLNVWLGLGAPVPVCVCIAQFCLWDIREIPGIWPLKITLKTRAVVRLCLDNERMYCTFSHHKWSTIYYYF